MGCASGIPPARVLGAGATGIVFRARQTSLDRFVVLKVLRPSLGAQARERFLHEARAAAAIEHDNVVAILEVGQWRDLAFFTMPWLPGETLQARLDRERVLDPEEVISITRQIAAGLAVAHRHGMVHRDVKPANIWIEESTGRVRLLDFGLARITDDDQHFTQTGSHTRSSARSDFAIPSIAENCYNQSASRVNLSFGGRRFARLPDGSRFDHKLGKLPGVLRRWIANSWTQRCG
ncbi:MAG: serine/threonine protein kinase [Planctomycetota bacterium]|nr:MAG: serine/threonine protein kinase [Planctomycetota bacterium]